jgi:hypothetical protein
MSMKHRLGHATIVLFAASLILMAVPAFADDLPTAGAVIDDFVAATGGADAYKNIKTTVSKGFFELQAMGLKAPIEFYQSLPGKTYTRIESEAFGSIESGTADDIFWEKSLMTGARIKDGEEKAAAKREADPLRWLKWTELYQSGETTEKVEMDGVSLYHVVLTPEVGQPEHYFFGVDDKLLFKSEMTVTSEMGAIKMEAYYKDYRETGGLKFPFATRQVLMGMQEMKITFDSVVFNTEIPEETFAIPDDVRAMVSE